MRRLGPWSPGLIDYLKRQNRTYDALVFFSLCHATTVQGIAVAPERSVLFPHLQLDPALRFGLWADVLGSVRAVGYVSAAERRLTRGFLRVVHPAEEVVGIGVDPPPQQTYPRHQQDPADTLARRRRERRRRTRRKRPSTSPAAACRSAVAIACTARSRCTAAASNRTTAARRCSSTSTATPRPTATRRSC